MNTQTFLPSKAAKRGTKQKHFEDPDTGLPVIGLTRRTDGRWRLIGTHKTFRESDPRKAIKRFYEITSAQSDEQAILEATDRTIYQQWNGKRFWKHVAEQILSRPQYAAEQTGIAWLAYGPDLRPPQKLPPLKELAEVWIRHAECSTAQKKKVAKYFGEFTAAMGVSQIREITDMLVVAYGDKLRHNGESKKTLMHRVAGIRRMFTFAKSRAIAIDAITKVLGYLEVLKLARQKKQVDPKPIELDDWKKLLAAATGDDKAMLLLMLNGAFYCGEVVELGWSDIRKDGCIVTNRNKTGECIRVCVLWQETIDALAAVEKRGDKIFYTYQGKPINSGGAFRRWQQVALKAGLATERKVNYGGRNKKVIKCQVTASQLRDGAFTNAIAAGVSEQFAKILTGQSCGLTDNYVARNPQMVAPACKAVYDFYFGKEKKAEAVAA